MDRNHHQQNFNSVDNNNNSNNQDAAASGFNIFESTPSSVGTPYDSQNYSSSYSPRVTSFTPTIPLPNFVNPVSQIHDKCPHQGYGSSFQWDSSVNQNRAFFTQPTFPADSTPFFYHQPNLRGSSSFWFNPFINPGYQQMTSAARPTPFNSAPTTMPITLTTSGPDPTYAALTSASGCQTSYRPHRPSALQSYPEAQAYFQSGQLAYPSQNPNQPGFSNCQGLGQGQTGPAQANFDGNTISNSSIYIAAGNCNNYTPGNQTLIQPSESCADISENLQRDLKEAATKECTSKGLVPLINQNIEVCKLDLTKNLSRNISKPPKKKRKTANAHYDEYDGHYNRRQDYEKIDLTHNSEILVENLFEKAAESNYPWLKNSVAVIGQPGIGKTTLCKVITEKALSGNTEGLKNIDLFFYIPVKKIGFETNLSLKEFLLKHALPTTTCNEVPKKDKLFNTQILNSENVFIAFDGLDEASTKWNHNYIRGLDWEKENNPLQYLLGLLNGELLPNAKKLFTSRQKHFFDMDESCRKMLVAEVLGLSTDSQEKLCRSICTDKQDDVWNIIKSNPNLSYSCYVPAKCIFIAFAIWKSLGENGSGQFHSITHVFANGFKFYFKSKLVRGRKEQKENQKYLNKIAKLAWNGFLHKRLVFENEHLIEAGIDPRHDNDILNAFVTDENWNMTILDGDKKKTFSHLTWQEYFAACYLVYFITEYDFCKLVPKFKSNRWEVVAKFVFGLCNSEVSEVAQCCFSDTISFVDDKKKTLLAFACSQMQKAGAGGKKLLQICSWLQEINDKDFYTEVGPLAPKSITLTGSILLTDISSIEKMCQKSTQTHDIRISKSCTFPYGSFRLLLDKLDGNKIQDFVITNNMSVQMIKDLSKTTPKIDGQLTIACHADPIALERLSKHYQPAQKVALLHCTCIFGMDNISNFCIDHIAALSLVDCKLSTVFLTKLAASISQLQQPMKSLDIDGHPIPRSVLKQLMSHDVVEKLDELYVTQYKISEDGIHAFGKVDLYANINKDVLQNQTWLEEMYTKAAFMIESIPNNICFKCNGEAYAFSCVMHLFPPTLELTLNIVYDFALQEVVKSIQKKIKSLTIGPCFYDEFSEGTEKLLLQHAKNIQDKLIIYDLISSDFKTKFEQLPDPKPKLILERTRYP